MTKLCIVKGKRKKVVGVNRFRYDYSSNNIVDHTKITHFTLCLLLVHSLIERHGVLETRKDTFIVAFVRKSFP